jgi:hypothetical protein
MVSPKSESSKYYNKGLSKLLSGKIIKEEFPMVDHIDCYVIDDLERIYMKIHLNDDEINSENMWEKNFVPYLLTVMVEKFLPYFGLSKKYKFNYIVLSPSGESIYQYIV